jgi:hypothetical protein
MVFISLTFGLLFGGRVNFAKELELLKQDREKTKRLQEELIQSRKMQEELNQQIKRGQENRTSSANSQSSTSLPKGTTVNRWAEVEFSSTFGYLYKIPIKSREHRRIKTMFRNGTRAFVFEKQGSWSKVKMEDDTVGWFYGGIFKWLN